jgi:protein gp37
MAKIMNRTKIEWTQYSWNPVTGCLHGCWYCYANKLFTRFHRSFEPEFHPERLIEPLNRKKPSKIFVCSVADLFAPWTPVEWRNLVLEFIEKCPITHTFQLLTKNPERIPLDYHFPDNVWVGTTVTLEPGTGDVKNIEAIKEVKAQVRFVSFEPLLGSIVTEAKYKPDLKGLQWIIVGKLTGSRRVKLAPYWFQEIQTEADYAGAPLFMKDNLCKELYWFDKRQEFPVETFKEAKR